MVTKRDLVTLLSPAREERKGGREEGEGDRGCRGSFLNFFSNDVRVLRAREGKKKGGRT